jgi:hypothetical protein
MHQSGENVKFTLQHATSVQRGSSYSSTVS